MVFELTRECATNDVSFSRGANAAKIAKRSPGNETLKVANSLMSSKTLKPNTVQEKNAKRPETPQSKGSHGTLNLTNSH